MQSLSEDGKTLLTEFVVAREDMLTKDSSDFAMKALKASVFGTASDLVEDLDDGDLDGQEETEEEDAQSTQQPVAAFVEAPPVKVTKPGKKELKAANKCSAVKADCGVMHDLMAGLWGEMKDLVDQKRAKTAADDAEYKKLKAGFNSLVQAYATQSAEMQAALAEATAAKASDTEQQVHKQKEKVELEKLQASTMTECKAAIKEIAFTEICGVIAVRNNMIKKSLKQEPPTDCKVGDWTPGQCSVKCDDSLKGGTQTMTREIIMKNTGLGSACPALKQSRPCNQIKCAVNCKLSGWSAFGKCTKECGGGVQTRTRTVTVKPKNGGEACEATQETQACNTGSCDSDCQLSEWTPWPKTCSQSCNAGYFERRKREVKAAVGKGTCAKVNDASRVERKSCNTQACVGNEVCNANMNLVIAVDASGSVTQKGFEIMKEFTKKIIARLGASVSVSVVQFGNGKLDDNKVVSNAKLISGLKSDKGAVTGAVNGMVWQKGFTNMAQAIMMSKDVLGNAPKGAQTVVLVITDGRPSFHFQTALAVNGLREGSRLMIAQVQRFRKQENAERLKAYVSEPWANNYKHIAGKKPLKENYDKFVSDILSKMCDKYESPAALAAKKR